MIATTSTTTWQGCPVLSELHPKPSKPSHLNTYPATQEQESQGCRVQGSRRNHREAEGCQSGLAAGHGCGAGATGTSMSNDLGLKPRPQPDQIGATFQEADITANTEKAKEQIQQTETGLSFKKRKSPKTPPSSNK